MSPHEILAEDVLAIHKSRQIYVTFVKEIRLPLFSHMVSTNFSYQSPLQNKLSVYNWNPGPRTGKEDAFEKQIAVKWHVVTLQEASDYVDHDIQHERFHVTHFAGCAILLNKDTFYPDISVNSTFMTQDEACKIKSLKENKDGSYRVFCHAPHFAVPQPVVKSTSR